MKQELKKLRKDVERYEGQIAMHTKMNNAKKYIYSKGQEGQDCEKKKNEMKLEKYLKMIVM